MIDLPKDNIGRQLLVDKIKYLIETLPEGNHFCLSLDGNWGSGKSYVIGMLQNQLEESPKCFVIHYDAWKNSFYSEPLIAILSCVIDTMQSKLSEIKGYNEVIKEAGKEAFNQFLKDNPIANKLSSVITTITKAIDKFRHPFQKDTTNGSINEFKSYQALLNEVQKCLNSIVDNDNIDKIVILVDEIDRCLPDQQLIVLERLHHLFEIKNCAVIIALNKKSICATFNTQFGGNGEEYLRKFFNYNFVLQTEYGTLLSNRINDFIDDINSSSQNSNNIFRHQESEPLIIALLNEISDISSKKGHTFSNRDIDNYFKTFTTLFRKLKPRNLTYMTGLMFIILYKQYDRAVYDQYKEGVWNENNPVTFKFRERSTPICDFTFGNKSFPYNFYEKNICNNFTCLMNCIRFRNSESILLWFQTISRVNYLNMDTVNENNKSIIDGYFKEIDNYG